MKGALPNIIALLGGAWTALCGFLFVGLLLSVAVEPSLASGPDRGMFVSPLIWTGVLTAIGVILLRSGLNLMRRH